MREQQYKQDVVCVFVCVHVCMYVCVRVRGHVLVGRGHEHSVRLTTAYNHHHKTIQRLVNKYWTRFRTKQKGNLELPRNITMCYRRNPSLRNKLAKTRYIQELATPTNRPTLKPHCTNKHWNRKCPTCRDIPTGHQFLRHTN